MMEKNCQNEKNINLYFYKRKTGTVFHRIRSDSESDTYVETDY